MILTPKKGVVHSKFEAVNVDGDGKETHVGVGKYKHDLCPQLNLLLPLTLFYCLFQLEICFNNYNTRSVFFLML